MPKSPSLSSFVFVAIIAVNTWGIAATFAQSPASPSAEPIRTTVTVDAAHVVRTFQPRMLGGTNVAEWNAPVAFTSPVTHQWLHDMRPGLIRLPGGSWSDIIYWNGNGVRDASGKLDPAKVGPDGYPAVDYRAYAPSFTVDQDTLHPTTAIQGNVDVKTLHEFIKSLDGPSPYVCVNAGTGRPVDAAEWVRWANLKMGYNARYWEIGNELDGGWEAGNTLPHHGGPLTGDLYAQRFANFAKAMKAVDPTIKIGGATTGAGPGSFSESMLKDAGQYVDFVSIHTYLSIGGETDEQALGDIDTTVARETNQSRTWITLYQPKRAGQIQVGYSEYNIRTGSSDLFSALWESEFLGAMALNGVEFATQWDSFTHTRGSADGQALFLGDEPYVRKAPYDALWLWNNYMGDQLLAAKIADTATPIHALASRTDEAVIVRLINSDRDRPAQVTVRLSDFAPAKYGEAAMVTGHEYFWNPLTHEPDWSTGPRIEKVPVGAVFTANLAPQSVTYIRVPARAHPALSALAVAALAAPKPVAAKPRLAFVIPDEIYAGDKIEGWVESIGVGAKTPYPKALAPAMLSASGGATFDRAQTRLAESLGRFFVQPTAPGPLTLTATSGGITSSKTILVKPSVPKPVVVWEFTKPEATDASLFASDFPLSSDLSVRPNKAVARVDLPAAGIIPSDVNNKRLLLQVKSMPDASVVKPENIRGVIFDVKAGADFASDDPNAHIDVVMQSPNNYWMVLGSVPLTDLSQWKSEEVDVTDPSFIPNMATAMNIWFVLRAAKPVKGSLDFDRVGFMVR